MRDAYGGLTSIWLFMIFFVIYVFFIGIALQFAKTYRVKNYVINFLEQQQYKIGDDLEHLGSGELKNYLDNVPYNVDNTVAIKDCDNYKSGSEDNIQTYHGICIVNKGSDDNPYFKITVYFIVEFPFLKVDSFAIPVTGETKVMTYR